MAFFTPCSPVSAMRMVEEFVDLEPEDVVIQNGANSAVGRAVIQFAHAQGRANCNSKQPHNHLIFLRHHCTRCIPGMMPVNPRRQLSRVIIHPVPCLSRRQDGQRGARPAGSAAAPK